VGTDLAGAGLGQILRGYRLAAGLTQEALAERSGLSARAIADMERGRTTRPYPSSVAALADALDLAGRQRELLDRASRPAADVQNVPEGVEGAPVPRPLPGAVRCFAGRTAEMQVLTGLLEDAERDGVAVVISAIAGTAGVGKTGLAVQWAHQIADRFPDGQLYVNLRGYDAGPPVPSADALAAFLRALGLPGGDIPAETEERAACYRSLLAGRRMLVVLDNARNAGQVRPLLPGAAGCVAVVTSRDSLAGLVARDGARRIELDVLPMPDAVCLLRELVGARVDADPGAAAVLAERCCRLPLALRVAAELAAARPEIPLADLAAELGDRQQGLELLDAGGDQSTAVRAVFSWSYQQLDPGTARAFALLGLHPGPDIDAYGAAALSGTALGVARHQLDRLARAHLIQSVTRARYGMHDLLRCYAADRAAETITVEERVNATARLLDYLECAASRAEALVQRSARSTAIADRGPVDYAVPEFANADSALAWLRAERSTLLACLDFVTADRQQARVVRLTAGVAYLLRTEGPRAEARARHAIAVQAAQDLGDRLGQAHALLCLGDTCVMTGDPTTAETLAQARDLFNDLGDELGRASALNHLGVEQLTARDPRATATLAEALDIFGDLGDQRGVANTLMPLAEVDRLSGKFANAATTAARALAIFGEVGDRQGYASAQLRLALAQCVTDSYPVAAQRLSEALDIFRELGDRMGQANALQLLAEMHCVMGHYARATQNLAEARGIFADLNHIPGEALTLTCLGSVAFATQDYGLAAEDLTGALAIWRKLGEQLGQAWALMTLGDVWRMTGDFLAAESALAEALAIHRDLAAPAVEAEVLNKTGTLSHSRGDLAAAAHCHQQALRLARRCAIPLEEGRALAGLGRCALSSGDHTTAVTLLRQAQVVIAPTGAAEAHAIASELDATSES
jgi:tetratricopeptide (TPR) repeat protein/transcriptional regulator with XRE-family HTH domain